MRRLRRILLFGMLAVLAYCAGQLFDIYRVGHLNRDREADCAIVLGAAAWHDKPSPVLRERLNHAITLFQNKKIDHLILTGGYGKDAPFSESEVGLEYCVDQGIPRSKIRVERESLNTIDNLREAKTIMEREDWNSALLVSDPWHLKRARRMATDLDMEVHVSATPSSRFQSFGAQTRFLFGEFALYHHYLFTGR
ncbi:MAG: YdcF family protein [Akkermansiaceae bacterium]